MISQKHTFIISLVLFCVLNFLQTIHAKSVYVINDAEFSKLQAYKIEDTNLIWQADYVCPSDPFGYIGAVGLAIHESTYGEFLFVTFEGSNTIELVNAKTMQFVDTVTATGAYDLAGIVVDQNKSKVYTMDRWTNHLYSYSWYPSTKIVTPDFNEPYYIELQGMEYGQPEGAFGIALDEENETLYVADNTDAIKCYDTNDWSKIGEVNNVSCNVISVAIDVNNQLLYYGSIGIYGDSDPNLYQYDISAQTEKSITVGSSVVGIAIDQDSSLIYLTTFEYGPTFKRLFVYDSNFNPLPLWDSNVLDNPAGVAVGSTAVYKPPFPLLELVKDDNDVDCVSPLISQAEHEFLGEPYNWLYYSIEYNANGHADTNVKITDYLPVEVDYNSSDPCGLYDPDRRMVTWNIGDMSASDSNTYRIQVSVNYYAKPGHKIFNLCEIESDEYYTFVIEDTDICCYGGDIIYVDADANDPNSYHNGTSWLHAYKDLQDALHTARTCGCQQIWVAKGTYKPTDLDVRYNDTSARSISFELVDNVAVYGGFPPGGGAWTERNPNTYATILSGDIGTPIDQNDNSYHVVKCVDINNAVLDSFTITAGKANAQHPDPNYCGGGVYCKDSNNITIRNCVVIQNEASSSSSYGGGIYFKDSNNLALTGCNVSENSALYGGGIHSDASNLYLSSCLFSNNSAISGGGTLTQNGSSSTIINCVFSMNTAENDGGGLFNSSSEVNVANCIFTGNVGKWSGGGVYSSSSELNITNCLFTGNTLNLSVNSSGGGMYNYQFSGTVDNCIFSGNTSKSGGGISNDDSEPNIINCIFTGNMAHNYGGGMHNQNYSLLAVANCIFNGNHAVSYGGGISNDYSGVDLGNCTFSKNWADYGGGICNINSNIYITNCILWANEAISYDEIYYYPSYPTINYSDIKGGWSGGNENIDKDPCFFEVEQPDGPWTENASYDNLTFQSTLTDENANWAVNELVGKLVNPYYTSQALQFFIVSNDINTMKVWSDVTDIAKASRTYQIYDYHLTIDSPCLDTGDPNADYTGQKDIDGEPRVFDGDYNEVPIVDMGADEYYWSPADINSDGFVNFFDYTFFASAWQSDPNKTNYNEDCDLEDNNSIDYNDIALFCEDWLWQTAWAKAFPSPYDELWGRSMSMGMGESMALAEGLYSHEQPRPQITAEDIEQILKWLADLWLTNEEVRKMISEDEWQKFIEAVIQAAKEQIYN